MNVKSQYAACSYGKLTFNPAPNRSGIQGSSIVNGVTEVSVNVATRFR